MKHMLNDDFTHRLMFLERDGEIPKEEQLKEALRMSKEIKKSLINQKECIEMLEMKANAKTGCPVKINGNFLQTMGELGQCMSALYKSLCQKPGKEVADTYKNLLYDKEFIDAVFKIGKDHGKAMNSVIMKAIIEDMSFDEDDDDDNDEFERLKKMLSNVSVEFLEGIDDEGK